MALFSGVYALLVPPQLLLAPVLTTTLSAASGVLGGMRTVLRTQADRVRQLEEELHRFRGRVAVEREILPGDDVAAADPVFLPPEGDNSIQHRTVGL
jgi:hypothetical protein